eukprot:4389548-Amphidinium_carterae.2
MRLSNQVRQDVGNEDVVRKAFVDDADNPVNTVGGLRNPFLHLLPHRRICCTAPHLLRILSSYLTSRPAVLDTVLAAVRDATTLKLQASIVKEVQAMLGKATGVTELQPVEGDRISTPILAMLLHGLALKLGDP